MVILITGSSSSLFALVDGEILFVLKAVFNQFSVNDISFAQNSSARYSFTVLYILIRRSATSAKDGDVGNIGNIIIHSHMRSQFASTAAVSKLTKGNAL